MTRAVNAALVVVWWVGIVIALPGLAFMGLSARIGMRLTGERL